MTRRLAVFDVDGTLVDSRRVIAEAMDRAFRACACPEPGYERTRHVVGLGLHDAFLALEPDAPADLVAALAKAYVAAFVELRTAEAGCEPLYPGAVELIAALLDGGWALGVATGKSRRGLETILAAHGLARYFHTGWCAEDGPGKPHPFMVEANMRACGAAADATVMIGDAVHDMRMARAAGVRAVGVAWGFGAAHEILEAGAHEVHHGFDTLAASLARFGERP